MARAIFCVARDPSHACRIVDDLKIARFASSDISVLLPDLPTSLHARVQEEESGARERAAGTIGITASGAFGWLASVGSMAIPGGGSIPAAVPLAGALGGVSGDAIVGGIAGALFSLGIPEFQAKRYEGKVKGGNALVAVRSRDAEALTRSRAVLERAGAEDISISGEIAVPNAPPPERPDRRRRTTGEGEGQSPHSCAQ
jgi:hypothetical protein